VVSSRGVALLEAWFLLFFSIGFSFWSIGGERLLLLARRITTPSPPHGSWEAVAGGTARRGGARLWAETHGFFFCSKLFLWATVELLGLAGWWLGGARVEGWLCLFDSMLPLVF
jgi:hypothetical protein